MSQAHCMLDA
jgi:hypothetical protein